MGNTTIKIINPNNKHFGKEIPGKRHWIGNGDYIGEIDGFEILFDKMEIDHWHFENQLIENYKKQTGYDVGQKVRIIRTGSCSGSIKVVTNDEYRKSLIFEIKSINSSGHILLRSEQESITCFQPDLIVLNV